ncbi:unnamed protein product [Paramecium pentaurelia]|uniref:Uncharacterized protein n=1 Tax=Paramecium pentaurelia TaxID=43138 RepID=A0A8S1XX58_9CILI|nr:unnamed protein product [Paramecium pentaurelia]
MNTNTDLNQLLFQKSNQPQQSQNPDITITSYSDISDGTPNKQSFKFATKTQQEEIQPQMQASNSIMESMTPKKINKLIDWSKYNVAPGNGKNIFPQVAGISIEFSNENSLNFKQQIKVNDDNFSHKFIEIEQKSKDFSNIDVLTIKNESLEQKKNESLQNTIQLKDQIITELKNELKQLQSQDQTLQQEIEKMYKILHTKEKKIENQEMQISNLTTLIKNEQQDQNMLSEIKIKEIKRSSVFEVNTKCQHCLAGKQELKNILKECSLENEQSILDIENDLPAQIREIVTLLLSRQREQIDIALEQQDEMIKELTDQIEQYKEQKTQVLEENNSLQKKIQLIFNEQQEQEKNLIEEFEKIKKINYNLVQENFQYKQQISSSKNKELIKQSMDIEKLKGSNSIQSDKSELYNDINLMRQQFQSQIKELLEKKQEYEKQIQQLKEESFSKSNYKFQIQSIKEKDKKNIELFSQIKMLQQTQKENEKSILELKDESEKLKKKVQFKNIEVKQYIEQNKIFQDKNTELNGKIIQLQQQLIQLESNHKDFRQSPKSRSLEQSRVISQYLQPNLNHQQLNQLINEYKSYQQEFIDLKVVFAEKIKQHEILQNKIQKLQNDNFSLNHLNQKLINENNKIKEDRIITKRTSEEFTTGVRWSAATGESIHMKTFIQQSDDDNEKKKQFNILELMQPELLSTEETIHILKEILIRSVKSLELIKKIYQISEIKELLVIFSKIDEKCLISNSKLNKIISCVLEEKRKLLQTNRNEKPDFFNS